MELSYISQGIVWVLAVLGILFNSTQTDADGNTIYWKHSIPLLTRTGKIVLVLITVSSVIAVISAHRQSAKAQENQAATQQKLQDVQTKADVLNNLLISVYSQGQVLSEDQRKQFTSVLSEQEKSGKSIATEIGTSAGLLKGRIENSIDLLHQSTTEIDRAVNPINSVLVSFDISPPKVSAISEYQDDVVDELKVANPNHLPDGVGLADRGVNGEVLAYDIDPKSALFPHGMNLPFLALNFVGIKIEFRVDPQDINHLKSGFASNPDLEIFATAIVDNSGSWQKDAHKAYLRYDLGSHRIRLAAYYVPSDPDKWFRTPKITSIPDLLKSQVVIRFFQFVGGSSVEESKALDELHGHFELDRVTLKMSGGRWFEFIGDTLRSYRDNNGHNFYIASFTPNRPQQKRQFVSSR